jgi:hypothetical protein
MTTNQINKSNTQTTMNHQFMSNPSPQRLIRARFGAASTRTPLTVTEATTVSRVKFRAKKKIRV